MMKFLRAFHFAKLQMILPKCLVILDDIKRTKNEIIMFFDSLNNKRHILNEIKCWHTICIIMLQINLRRRNMKKEILAAFGSRR